MHNHTFHGIIKTGSGTPHEPLIAQIRGQQGTAEIDMWYDEARGEEMAYICIHSSSGNHRVLHKGPIAPR